MSKFTRGPWEYIVETGYMNDCPAFKCHRVKIGQQTLTVGGHDIGWKGEPEVEANARLIATAPELLYELQETHAALCFDSEYLGSKRYHRNKAAIKKAGGEL